VDWAKSDGRPALVETPGFSGLREATEWLDSVRADVRRLLDRYGAVYLRGGGGGGPGAVGGGGGLVVVVFGPDRY
jgi:hypothetical protein